MPHTIGSPARRAVVPGLLLGLALPAAAQTPLPRWEPAFEVGVRAFTTRPVEAARGGYELYHVYPAGPVLPALRVSYAAPGGLTRTVLGGNDIGERDGNLWLRFSKLRTIDATVRWDRIQHTYATTARFPGYDLGTPRLDAAGFNALPFAAPVRITWDPVRFGLRLTPNDRWDLKAEATWIEKGGNRPMGMAFGSPGGNHREILEPIDQRVQDLRLTQSLTTKRFLGSLSYTYSHFGNSLTSIEADNPQRTTNATNGAARGRSALAPSNVAHTVAFTGALRLPMRSRITGTFSYGWRKQNEPFIPMTSNALFTDPALTQGPSSLEGDVRTILVNLGATVHPADPLTLTARARHYEYQDKTAERIFPAVVLNDATFEAEEHERERFPYAKDNASLAATWRFGMQARLTGAWGWESWERAAFVRNLRHTDEHSPRVTLDLTPGSWLLFRGSASVGWRRGRDDYRQVHEEQLPELRRFDQADRDRTRVDLLADLALTDQLNVTGTWGWVRDTFPESAYGTQRLRSHMVGGDLTWVPSDRFSGGFSWTQERFRQQQRSRNRVPPNLLDNLTYDWVGRSEDLVTTWGFSFDATLVPGRLEMGGAFEVADATLTTRASNPQTPTGGTATQNQQSVAVDFPDITDKRTPASWYLRYQWHSDWAVTARYVYDQWSNVDWRTDNLLPAPANSTDRFLGDDYLNYNGQFLMFSISYRPHLLRRSRPAL